LPKDFNDNGEDFDDYGAAIYTNGAANDAYGADILNNGTAFYINGTVNNATGKPFFDKLLKNNELAILLTRRGGSKTLPISVVSVNGQVSNPPLRSFLFHFNI